MVSRFRPIADEFCDEIRNIRGLVSAFDKPEVERRLRTAASNSAMLLLAATFEAFVREMAGQVARAAVGKATAVNHVPNKILRTAWRRTFESVARVGIPQNTETVNIHQVVGDAQDRTEAVFAFLRGDLGREIYSDLVQNDVNMRAQEINRLFAISEVPDVCSMVSQEQDVIAHFNVNPNESNSELVGFIDWFIGQRNSIAHAVNSSFSVAPKDVGDHIDAFSVFAKSLCAVLEQEFPTTNGASKSIQP